MIPPPVACRLIRLRSVSSGACTRPVRWIGACLLLTTSYAGAASPRADLSIGTIAAPATAPDAKADALAHYAAARELESEGSMRAALKHYSAAAKADPGNTDLVAHAADLVDEPELSTAIRKLAAPVPG